MYVCMFIVLSTIWRTQADPVPGQGSLVGYCRTGQHCAADECCVAFPQRQLVGRRRQLGTHPQQLTDRRRRRSGGFFSPFGNVDLMTIISGKCEKLVGKNDTCIIPGMAPSPPAPDLHWDCPCATGLYCLGSGTVKPRHGEIGLCTKDITVRSVENLQANEKKS